MKKGNILKGILFSILTISIVSVGALGGYMYYQAKKTTSNLSKSNKDLGIEDKTLEELKELGKEGNFDNNKITNIALYGIDSRDINSLDKSRSDSIIILSIDRVHNKIKLSSIMRDSYVYVEGHGKTKITHAYAYGGPQLAIKTLNQNFGLNIKDFVTIDFFGLVKVIDSIGGVELNIDKSEVNETNKYIKEVAALEKKSAPLLTTGGLQNLNGIQAVAYGRIRHVGNGDYERTDRQRKILEAMYNKIKSSGILEYSSLVKNCFPCVKTSFAPVDILKLGINIIQSNKFTIEQKRFPEDGKGEIINKIWYLVTDLNKMKTGLRNFIYEVKTNNTVTVK